MSERTSGFLNPLETASDAQRRKHHDAVLRDAVRRAWDAVPFYRERLEAAGIAPGAVSLADLSRIPLTRKPEAQAAGLGTGAIPLAKARRIFVSPGPHVYASQRRDDPPLERGRTPLALPFHAMGFREDDIVLNTFSYHLTPGGFGLEDQLVAAGCAVIPAGPQSTEVQARVLAMIPVTGYVGTPTFLRLLCEKADEIGIKPREEFSLQVAFVTAEKLTEGLRAELEERTGARVRQIYGSADGLLPAYECWAARGMHLHPDQITEVLDPATGAPAPPGETGEIVATNANPNRPLVRFANHDLVVLRDDECPCGRTGPRIDRFVGRLDDAVKVRGMFVYPDQIGAVLERFPGIERWQAVVEHAGDGDRLVVRVQAAGDVPQDAILDSLREAIRVRADVERVAPGAIGDDANRLDDRRG